MAKIYNFHIYSDYEENNFIDEFEQSNIRIANSIVGYSSKLSEMFENDDISIANEIKPSGEMGGGYGSIFPLNSFIDLGVVITLYLSGAIGTGFFGEIGADLYRKLLKVLFNKNKSTKLVIQFDKKSLELIIPPNTPVKNLIYIENYLNDLNDTDSGIVIFDGKSKNFIYLVNKK